VLTTQTALPILPTITTAIELIKDGTVDYDQSMAGSFIVELLAWYSWLRFKSFYYFYLGWIYVMSSLGGTPAYISDCYYCDITSPKMNRKNHRRIKDFYSTYGYDPFVAVDERYLYFAGLMLLRTVSYLFTCNAKWQVYIRSVRLQFDEILRLPLCLSTSASPLWPPDGIIMAILVLFFILGFHFFILLVSVPYALFSKLKRVLFFYSSLYKVICHVTCSRLSKCSIFGVKFKLVKLLLFLVRFRVQWSDSTLSTTRHVFTSYALSSDDMDSLENSTSFNSDSQSCICDNSANTHIWNCVKDFIPASLVQLSASAASSVVTIGGSDFHPTSIGDLKLTWTDDDGVPYTTILKDVLYFPDSPVNVLSVTAFAAQLDDDHGTWIKTSRHQSVFTWDNEKFSKTLVHPASNLPQMTVNNGFSVYTSFCNFLEKAIVIPRACKSVFLVDKPSDNTKIMSSEEKSMKDQYTIGQQLSLIRDGHCETVILESVDLDMDDMVPYFTVKLSNGITTSITKEFLHHINDQDVSFIPITAAEIQEQATHINPEILQALLKPTAFTPLTREFMDLHDQLRHMPFPIMFKLCQEGKIDKKLLALQSSKLLCPSCIFGNCKKTSWRKGTRPAGHVRTAHASQVGEKIHLDQMQSKQPGLVPRLDGRHTKDRITSVSVFLDDNSGHSYSHLQTSTGGDETLAAKHAFEIMAHSFGIPIQSYHADNGIFAEKLFRNEISMSNQSISFCGVGAHHQNGFVENHIGRLTRGARILLLSAQRRWPEAIGEILWPFAWKDYERCYNELSISSDGRTPIEKFSSTRRELVVRDYHPWGCPVYVLTEKLQSQGAKIPKWNPRARLGIYLGRSPCHAGNVALVLNPKTLHVSPQFHVTFDDKFMTVPFLRSGDVPPTWTDLVLHNTESATDSAFDSANTWMTVENTHPLGGSSNEEVISASPVDNIVSTSNDSSTSPLINGASEEAGVTSSDISEEGSIINATSEEGPARSAVSEEEIISDVPEPYRMEGLPNLDNISLRRSKRSQKPSEKGAAIKSAVQKKFFNLFSMFCLFSVSALATSATLIP